MTKAEMVTDFKLEGKTVKEVIEALRGHCQHVAKTEEYGFSYAWWIDKDKPPVVPETFRWAVAFAIEGDSEGWYVHVGTMIHDDEATTANGLSVYKYVDWGFAKVWTPEDAYALAREAQRFLSAARWG